MELADLVDVHLGVDFFYLAVNKLIADKIQNIFSSGGEHSEFIKFS